MTGGGAGIDLMMRG